MVGPTLVEIREHIETLASEDGEYYIVCGRTGDRPVPAAGKRFADRATARSAARATEQYRTALRRYDPQVPYYDLIVCQDTEPIIRTEDLERKSRTEHQQPLSEPVLDSRLATHAQRDLVEFCHRAAGAVFETLSTTNHDHVERAIMDAYFELAETIADPDELCLYLLESMATELDDRLDASEQVTVLEDAATRLEPAQVSETPLTATLTFLEDRGLVDSYTRSPWSIDLDGGARSIVVQLSEYALSPRDGRLPVLPLVLDLYRRQPTECPTSLRVVERENGWRITFVLAETAEPTGVASVPIDSEGDDAS